MGDQDDKDAGQHHPVKTRVKNYHFIVAGLVMLALACSGSQPEPRRDAATPLSVTRYGIGPVRAGMSVAEASKALGTTLGVTDGGNPGACQYARRKDPTASC